MSLIYKPQHGSLEWLRIRHRDPEGRPVISASDAAAVHGVHRFKTTHQLFAEKLADEPPVTETTAAMDRGNRLEPIIGQWASDLMGVRLVQPSYMYWLDHSNHPMIATLDFVDEYGYENSNPQVIVEVKTYNGVWDGILPPYWRWQGVQQAICVGPHIDKITWAIFDSTLQIHLFEQTISEAERHEHLGAVQDFLFWVNLGTPNPEWPASYDDVSLVFPEASDKQVDITNHRQLLSELKDVQDQKKQLTEIEDELKAKIATLLGDGDTGLVDGSVAVTWKQQKRSSFDGKGLQKAHPDLYDEFTKISTFRVLRVKGDK
jgi:hypothetical protein